MLKGSRHAHLWAGLILALLCSPLVPAQTIEIYAGGRFFQNVPGTSVQVAPQALAVGPDGMLYIVDSTGHLLRLDPATGNLSSLPGIAGQGNFNFGYPGGMAFNSAGQLFINDTSQLFRVDIPAGTKPVVGPLPLSRAMQFRTDGILVYAAPDENRVRALLPSGDLIVVAGTGVAGYSGDGGLTQLAQVNSPYGVTNDAAGNLYIADTQNSRVRKVNVSTQVITTYAGNGTCCYNGDNLLATQTNIAYPQAIAVGPGGHLYVASQSRIVKINASTKRVTTIAGNGTYGNSGDGGPATAAQFSTPFSMAFDAAGNLYFDDQYRVRKVSAATGIITTVAGNGEYLFCGEGVPARAACLSGTYGIDVDSQQNVVFTGDAINRVRQVSASTGLVTTVAQLGSNISGRGVEHDASGNFYVPSYSDYVFRIDAVTHAVTKIAGNGSHGLAGDGGPATSATLAAPGDVAFDAAGNAYISDTGNFRIRRVDAATGVISTYAGTFKGFTGDGGPASSARLDSVTTIEFDPAGNLVLSDGWNCRLRRIDSATGIITTIAGNGTCTSGTEGDGGPATAASIGSYTGFAFDPSGNIYLAYSTHLRRIDATTGIITTVPPPTADGWKVEGAGFQFPWAMEFDAQGNLYVGDRYEQVIFRISGLP